MKIKFLLIACLFLSVPAQSSVVINGVSTNGQYSLKAFGHDLVLYSGNKRVTKCTNGEVDRGIDDNGSPYILDTFNCDNNTTLGIKTFGNIEEGGWVMVVGTKNGKPVNTMMERFTFKIGE